MKTTFLTILLIVISINLSSQTLIEENKIWNIVNCIGWGGCWTESYKINGDTIIDQIEYKRLLRTNDTTLTNWGFFGGIREIENKVYLLHSNSENEILLYDFNLTIGETFSSFYYDCPIEFELESIDTLTVLNGEQREKYNFSNNESWIKGIGSLNGLVYVGVYWCEADMYYDLSCCFENDEQIFQSDNYDNCFIYTVGVEENENLVNHKIFPNPFTYSTVLQFDFQENQKYWLEIIDQTGQIINRIDKITTGEIEIRKENMNTGLYFYILYDDNDIIATGKMIIK
ncbi:MAG: T9SS type A sorting domain-containing protein [Bacteroidetes bacterium]|nr:T9SS type A sorting domain-containing protein [Bacteroidota bacterium]MBL6944887.1 T9SS type A sorting domain-containing protein [Bacteroidales bacterium]